MIEESLELMNSFIKIIVIAVLTFINSIEIYSQECKVELNIKSDIENVNVFVDDSLYGSGKNVIAEVSRGIHKIKAEENNYRWDAKTYFDTLFLQTCNDTTLNFVFLNDVLLKSDPENAAVFSSDSLLGYTPLHIPLSLHSISLHKNGYESKTIKYSDIDLLNPVKMNFTGEYEDGTFFNKTLFKILIGSMLALGATTAYFKLEADKYFDDYQINGDHSLLDKTHKYDLVSGVSFVALQINFGLIIYYFLVD